jgi:endonuclease/exonuclease/phosphatase family metal-dependent hydrolase
MIWQPVLLIFALIAILAYKARPTRETSGDEINSPTGWEPFEGTTTIATYNVCGGRGEDGIRDITRAAQVLAPYDIAGVQELHAADWSGRPSQLEQIAKLNNVGWLFSATRTRWFREYRGNGLLSRFPADMWYSEPLIDRSGHRFRNLLATRFLIGDEYLWVLVTHLHTREGRELQLKRVLERFMEHSPAILIGDLNTRRDDPVLGAALSDPTVSDAIGTALGPNDPVDRVDWILTRGLTILGGGKTGDGVSDHPCFNVTVSISEPF